MHGVKNLTPRKSRGGRKGDGGGEGKAGLAVTLLSIQIFSYHPSILSIQRPHFMDTNRNVLTAAQSSISQQTQLY